MRLSIAIAVILMSAPVEAGSISFQVTQGGQGTLTKTYTLADSDIDRIVAAEQESANTAVNGVATRTQVLQNWITKFVTATKNNVTANEAAAAIAALPPITPINPQ